MNILKIFRSTNLAIVLSIILLVTSCSQYEKIGENEQAFDYSLYNEFKAHNFDVKQYQTTTLAKTTYETKFQEVIDQVNLDLGTDLSFSKEAIELANYDADLIYQKALAKGWISSYEIDLGNAFIDDLVNFDFDEAISKYEQRVLNLSLSSEEFAKQNKLLNIYKSVNDENPNLFNLNTGQSNSRLSCGWCKCAAASVALYSATMGLASCVTVFACGLAIVLVYAASNSFAAACLDD